jgi:outer membrane protein
MTLAPLLLATAQVLTLAQAESNTHANLPAIHVAVAQTAAQQAVRDVVFTSYLPQLSGSATFYPLQTGTGGQALSLGASLPKGAEASTIIVGQTASFGVSVSQLIYDFNQTIDKIKANDQLVVAQRDNESVVWNGVLLTTRAAYFNCQQNYALVRVAQQNLDDQSKHVEQMTAYVKAGTHPPVDLAQAQQQAAAANYQLIQAKGAYLTSKAALQQAMGVDAPPDFDVNTDEFPPVKGEDSTTDTLLPEAIAARPEIRAIDDQIAAQRLTISANRESWAPSLSAVASAAGSWADYEGASSLTPNAKAGLVLNWPFYLGGIAQASTRQAEAVIVQLQAQEDADKQQVRNDVENGLIAIRAAKGQVASAQEALSYAKEQLRLAEGQYQAGVGIALGVFDAQVAVYTAGGQVAQSTDALATGRAQLIKALGREKY